MPEGPNIFFYGDTIFNPDGSENKLQAYVGLNKMIVCIGKCADGVWQMGSAMKGMRSLHKQFFYCNSISVIVYLH